MTHPHKARWLAKSSSMLKQTGKAVFRQAWFRFVLKRAALVVLPFLLVLLTETLTRRSWYAAFVWMADYNNEFVLNYWIAFLATLVTAALTGRTRAASV